MSIAVKISIEGLRGVSFKIRPQTFVKINLKSQRGASKISTFLYIIPKPNNIFQKIKAKGKKSRVSLTVYHKNPWRIIPSSYIHGNLRNQIWCIISHSIGKNLGVGWSQKKETKHRRFVVIKYILKRLKEVSVIR